MVWNDVPGASGNWGNIAGASGSYSNVPGASGTWVNVAGFSPIDIGGCILWLRSDLGITKDGADRVENWADQSGSGYNFAQITDSKKPIWTADQINGYPALVFDGIDDWLSNAAIALSQPATVFIVAKYVTPNNNAALFDGETGVGNTGRWVMDSGLGSAGHYELYAGSGIYSSESISMDTWHLFIGVINGASSSLQIDNNALNNGNVGANNLDKMILGALGYTVPAWFFKGGIREFIIYNSVLSEADRLLVKNYL